MRNAFGQTLVELAQQDERIILLIGDYESGTDQFRNAFPTRWYNMGTAEQLLISVASGMATEGFVPVVYSITPFALERPFEQLKMAGLDHRGIIVVGYDDYPTQGPTHKALDPEAIARMIPNMRGFFPRNSQETADALRAAHAYRDGPSLIRLLRDNTPKPK